MNENVECLCHDWRVIAGVLTGQYIGGVALTTIEAEQLARRLIIRLHPPKEGTKS